MNGTNQTLRSIAGLLVLVTLLICRSVAAGPSPAAPPGLYDPDPNHIWNRLYHALFVRTAVADGREYGFDELDPLLWAGTKHLLEGPSHAEAIKLLDEFLQKHAEKEISDPLKRAILQRDLWAVFDWSAAGDSYPLQRRTLQRKLAQVIQRLALTSEQIESLPDNYADAVNSHSFALSYNPGKPDAPFLPPDLFDPGGPWVCLGDPYGPVAPTHQREFGGRSAFLIFMKVSEGRAATLKYLDELRSFPAPWIANPNHTGDHPSDADPLLSNPDLPQFPVGTEVALVRQLFLIDNQGELHPTLLTESIQLRVYRSIPPAPHPDVQAFSGAKGTQDFYEYRLSRRKLFAGRDGGLRSVSKGEQDFLQFHVLPSDPMDLSEEDRKRADPSMFRPEVLGTCLNCHNAPGIHSLNAYVQLFEIRRLRPPQLSDSDVDFEQKAAIVWKKQQYTWGLLQGFWQR